MRRRLLALPTVALVVATAQPISAVPPQPASPVAVETLIRAPLHDLATAGSACSLEMAMPGIDTISSNCEAASSAPEAEAGETLTFHDRGAIRTARWGAQLDHMSGGRLARVHGYGDVAVHDEDGELVWARSGWSLHDDWGVDEPTMVPFVAVGSSPVNPFVVASERPFAVGDLTGDGTDDVVVGHLVRTPNGGGFHFRSRVSVLDGRDGAVRWFQVYEGYVSQLLVSGGTLLVGTESGAVRTTLSGTLGQAGSTSRLRGLNFTAGPGTLEADEAWSMDTGAGWARLLAVEPVGGGSFALGWTSKPLGATGTAGRVLLMDAATGDVAWDVPTSGYPRVIRYDNARERVTVLEQADQEADTNKRRGYWITGLSRGSGTIASRIQRTGALAVSFEIGDVTGGPEPEWVTGDLQQLQQTPAGAGAGTYQAMRVMAADGASPSTLWTHRVALPSEFVEGRGGGLASWPTPYALSIGGPSGDRRVLVATWHALGSDGVRALRGTDGEMAWERFGNVTFPLFLLEGSVDGEDVALAVSRNQVLRAVRVGDGEDALHVPLLGDLFATQAFEVNGDGVKDILAGGESGAVFALDATRLSDDPEVLWRTTVGTGVRRLELVDVTGDGEVELLAAASSGVAALDPRSGDVVWRTDLPGRFTWAFALGELDGEPGTDLVVPERALTAIGGRDGRVLWEHVPDQEGYFSEPTITPEGQVVAQGLIRFPSPLAPRHHQLVIGLDAETGDELWSETILDEGGIVELWRSTAPAGRTADGQGTKVAVTWNSRQMRVVGFRALRTDVYDARSGDVLSTTSSPQGVVHMATLWDPDRGLFEHNWKTVQNFAAPDSEVVWEFTGDMGWADLGEHGEAFLRFDLPFLAAHPSDDPMGERGTDHPAPIGTWRELFVGEMTIADLDGDGVDEVIASMFDWPGFARVAAFKGTSVIEADTLAHGLVVLEATDA